MTLSPREMELIKCASKEAIGEFTKTHPCRFDDATAQTVHELHDVKVSEGADAGTFRLILQWGTTAQDITKSMRRFALFGLIVLLVIFFGPNLVSAISKWCVK